MTLTAGWAAGMSVGMVGMWGHSSKSSAFSARLNGWRVLYTPPDRACPRSSGLLNAVRWTAIRLAAEHPPGDDMSNSAAGLAVFIVVVIVWLGYRLVEYRANLR